MYKIQLHHQRHPVKSKDTPQSLFLSRAKSKTCDVVFWFVCLFCLGGGPRSGVFFWGGLAIRTLTQNGNELYRTCILFTTQQSNTILQKVPPAGIANSHGVSILKVSFFIFSHMGRMVVKLKLTWR